MEKSPWECILATQVFCLCGYFEILTLFLECKTRSYRQNLFLSGQILHYKRKELLSELINTIRWFKIHAFSTKFEFYRNRWLVCSVWKYFCDWRDGNWIRLVNWDLLRHTFPNFPHFFQGFFGEIFGNWIWLVNRDFHRHTFFFYLNFSSSIPAVFWLNLFLWL